MKQTFHVDLLDTTLADFCEHYEHSLSKDFDELLDDIEWRWIVWDDEPVPVGNLRIENWEARGHIRIVRKAIGDTSTTYTFRYSDTSEPGPVRFALQAVRYRQSRLKVVIWEADGDAYAKLFRAWLDFRWGDDGYEDREGKPAASMIEDPYQWAAEQKARGATYESIYLGWEERYVAKYGRDKLLDMQDPRGTMERTIRRRQSGQNRTKPDS